MKRSRAAHRGGDDDAGDNDGNGNGNGGAFSAGVAGSTAVEVDAVGNTTLEKRLQRIRSPWPMPARTSVSSSSDVVALLHASGLDEPTLVRVDSLLQVITSHMESRRTLLSLPPRKATPWRKDALANMSIISREHNPLFVLLSGPPGSSKTYVASLLAQFIATNRAWQPYLGPFVRLTRDLLSPEFVGVAESDFRAVFVTGSQVPGGADFPGVAPLPVDVDSDDDGNGEGDGEGDIDSDGDRVAEASAADEGSARTATWTRRQRAWRGGSPSRSPTRVQPVRSARAILSSPASPRTTDLSRGRSVTPRWQRSGLGAGAGAGASAGPQQPNLVQFIFYDEMDEIITGSLTRKDEVEKNLHSALVRQLGNNVAGEHCLQILVGTSNNAGAVGPEFVSRVKFSVVMDRPSRERAASIAKSMIAQLLPTHAGITPDTLMERGGVPAAIAKLPEPVDVRLLKSALVRAFNAAAAAVDVRGRIQAIMQATSSSALPKPVLPTAAHFAAAFDAVASEAHAMAVARMHYSLSGSSDGGGGSGVDGGGGSGGVVAGGVPRWHHRGRHRVQGQSWTKTIIDGDGGDGSDSSDSSDIDATLDNATGGLDDGSTHVDGVYNSWDRVTSPWARDVLHDGVGSVLT